MINSKYTAVNPVNSKDKNTPTQIIDKSTTSGKSSNVALKDDLGYYPKMQPGMKFEDLETIVHTTINYIKEKYPNERNTMDRWLVLIGEEFGELCEAINDGEINNVIEEGTQTIAAIYLMLTQFVQDGGNKDEKNI